MHVLDRRAVAESCPNAHGPLLTGSPAATSVSRAYQAMSSCTAVLAAAFLTAMMRCAPLSKPVKW